MACPFEVHSLFVGPHHAWNKCGAPFEVACSMLRNVANKGVLALNKFVKVKKTATLLLVLIEVPRGDNGYTSPGHIWNATLYNSSNNML